MPAAATLILRHGKIITVDRPGTIALVTGRGRVFSAERRLHRCRAAAAGQAVYELGGPLT
jgi:hypothetical protein